MKVWTYMRKRAHLEGVEYSLPRPYYALCNNAFGVCYDEAFEVLYDEQEPFFFKLIMDDGYFSDELEEHFRKLEIDEDKLMLKAKKRDRNKKSNNVSIEAERVWKWKRLMCNGVPLEYHLTYDEMPVNESNKK